MAHTLLLADDSVTIQRVVELTFAGEDIRIVSVGNGQQAIDSLSDDPPDIVLADIGMPLLDGYAVASFVRNHDALRDVPVLLMVGAFDPVDEDRVQASGASGVLVKPFEPTLVISRVKELLGLGTRPDTAAAAPGTPVEPVAEPSGDAPSSAPVSDVSTVTPASDSVALGAAAPAPMSPLPSAIADFEQDWLGQDSSERLVATLADQPPASAEGQAPAVEALWAQISGSEASTASRPPVTFASPPPGASVADAFSALLAAEQGELVPPPPASALDESQMDAIVEQVAARVMEHLGTSAVRERADRIIVDVAERLVREEIVRIRDAAAARHG